ncbi:MAG: trypsin-like peptidase domain-containing protein [Anaerolineae bacterium]|nr:trypsin-like peptidase domain-containing protein [Anaerolineae bacterium]
MQNTMRVIVLVVVLFIAATGCAGRSAPPPQASASTPVAGLPMNAAFRPDEAVQTGGEPTPVPDSIISAADAEYLLLTNIYERLAPSVVNIEVVVETPHPGLGDEARGSGFVYDLNGYIITNAHVINDATEISVTFNDGYVARAESIGLDLFSDLAVIKVNVDAARLNPVSFANADDIRVGQRAIAIGNPFGLASSMTVGIVSGLGRQLPSAEMISNDVTPGFQNPSIIQVDTDINPGNSGGPLLNSRGEVIGVNTAIRTESGIFEGVGFAVPVSTVLRVVPELIEKGRVEYAWLGITSLSAEDGLGVAALAEPLGLPVNAGVLIDTIAPNSPASKAGLQGGNIVRSVRQADVCAGGDIIVAIDGDYINSMDELMSYLVVNTAPGQTINLLIVRGDQTFEVPVLLEPRPTGDTNIPVTCGP